MSTSLEIRNKMPLLFSSIFCSDDYNITHGKVLKYYHRLLKLHPGPVPVTSKANYLSIQF